MIPLYISCAAGIVSMVLFAVYEGPLLWALGALWMICVAAIIVTLERVVRMNERREKTGRSGRSENTEVPEGFKITLPSLQASMKDGSFRVSDTVENRPERRCVKISIFWADGAYSYDRAPDRPRKSDTIDVPFELVELWDGICALEEKMQRQLARLDNDWHESQDRNK